MKAKEAVVKKTKMKASFGSKLFDVCNVIFMASLIVIIMIPLIHVVCASFSSPSSYVRHEGLLFYPLDFCMDAYKAVAKNKNIITGYMNTIFIVVVGTTLNVLITLIAAYCLSRKNVMWSGIMMMGIVFSMYFSGGMIPFYLVVKGVGLNNSIWSLIIPTAISTYNLIIMRTAMVSVPDSLEESAKLDGANQWTILWKIMVPLVKPTIAVICLYYAVTHWNSWFNAMLFIRNKSGYPLQLVLREILLQNDTSAMTAGADDYLISETIQFATIVVATLPILTIYPFIQKYFVKGVMIGAVKG
ncbi:ABC transporter permease subunit [Clostridium sp. MCC353]|uniref:carbohydrate ABC transporter permease n=1 Tax=Clostridium sp. MCC353 TaxID=2592646 RepID=UPI001C01409A|nr:carbohydrate ABC transporter permease [Clostridium sp. MCC353]MBT9777695.1 ABC transporter permease subunit [Clostridium sp. MCC353]